jgi:hypothetical protein
VNARRGKCLLCSIAGWGVWNSSPTAVRSSPAKCSASSSGSRGTALASGRGRFQCQRPAPRRPACRRPSTPYDCPVPAAADSPFPVACQMEFLDAVGSSAAEADALSAELVGSLHGLVRVQASRRKSGRPSNLVGITICGSSSALALLINSNDHVGERKRGNLHHGRTVDESADRL